MQRFARNWIDGGVLESLAALEASWSAFRNRPYSFLVIFRLLKPVLLDEFVICLRFYGFGNTFAHGGANGYHCKRSVFGNFFG